MIGVIFVTKPAFLFGGHDIVSDNHILGCLLICLAAFLFSLSMTLVKIIGTVSQDVKV